MKKNFTIIGKAGGGSSATGSVRYDVEQQLTTEEKKQALDNLGVDLSAQLKREIVDELPTVGEDNVIYMVIRAEAEEQNVYDEYMYIDGQWDKIGSTDVDLSDYYTKEETDTAIQGVKETLQDEINVKVDNSTYETKISEIEGVLDEKTTMAEVEAKGYLTEHQPLKTINGESIIGTGDLEIKGFSGDYNDLTNKPTILSHWFGTQEEYDAITVKDENTIYHIEGGGIDLDNYYTKEEVDGMVESKANTADVYTKSEVYNKSEIDEKLDGINTILSSI